MTNKANINSANEAGETPLHLAAQGEYIDTVKVLIDNRANPLLKNKDGKTPRDLAQYDDIKKLLEKAEEKQLRQQAFTRGLFAGSATAVLGAAVAVALFATGTVAVELVPILIAVVAVTVAALAVSGVTYMLSEPSVEQVAGNERKV